MVTNANYLKKDDFNRICDASGMKCKASHTLRRWDNKIVRRRHWEIRQPQDFVKAIPDVQTVPDARPPSTPIFVSG